MEETQNYFERTSDWTATTDNQSTNVEKFSRQSIPNIASNNWESFWKIMISIAQSIYNCFFKTNNMTPQQSKLLSLSLIDITKIIDESIKIAQLSKETNVDADMYNYIKPLLMRMQITFKGDENYENLSDEQKENTNRKLDIYLLEWIRDLKEAPDYEKEYKALWERLTKKEKENIKKVQEKIKQIAQYKEIIKNPEDLVNLDVMLEFFNILIDTAQLILWELQSEVNNIYDIYIEYRIRKWVDDWKFDEWWDYEDFELE